MSLVTLIENLMRDQPAPQKKKKKNKKKKQQKRKKKPQKLDKHYLV